MRWFLLVVLLLVAPSACGIAADEPKLTDISSVEPVKTIFNAGAGKVRLILLLSPT